MDSFVQDFRPGVVGDRCETGKFSREHETTRGTRLKQTWNAAETTRVGRPLGVGYVLRNAFKRWVVGSGRRGGAGRRREVWIFFGTERENKYEIRSGPDGMWPDVVYTHTLRVRRVHVCLCICWAQCTVLDARPSRVRQTTAIKHIRRFGRDAACPP